nr:type III pantothenate kinase [Limnobacter parvus]
MLCIDAGNTLVKWCVHTEPAQPFGSKNEFFSHPTSGFKPFCNSLNLIQDQLGQVLKKQDFSFEAVVLSNVLGPDFEQAVRQLCDAYQVPLHVLAVNTNTQLQSTYDNPAALGKDRWAACLALTQISRFRVNLLVSFGTATTLDVVVKTANWQHQGGFIVPGVQTMLRSLNANTAELPQVELQIPVAGGVWPTNTQQAIGEGVGRMQVALVESLAQELQTRHGELPAVWFCGGFASTMQTSLPQAFVLEHAVFKGLVFDYQLSRRGSR